MCLTAESLRDGQAVQNLLIIVSYKSMKMHMNTFYDLTSFILTYK